MSISIRQFRKIVLLSFKGFSENQWGRPLWVFKELCPAHGLTWKKHLGNSIWRIIPFVLKTNKQIYECAHVFSLLRGSIGIGNALLYFHLILSLPLPWTWAWEANLQGQGPALRLPVGFGQWGCLSYSLSSAPQPLALHWAYLSSYIPPRPLQIDLYEILLTTSSLEGPIGFLLGIWN